MYLQAEVVPQPVWMLEWLPGMDSIGVVGHIQTIEEFVEHADETFCFICLQSTCKQ